MYKNIIVGFILATTITFASILTSAGSTLAAETRIGDLTIMHPTLRATLPGAKVAAGYLFITNTGSSDDRLVSGEADFAGRTEVHEMKMVNQVMKMQQLKDGLAIPADSTEKLAPGGNHVMFMKLQMPLKAGDTHKVTLEFERAGKVELPFVVKSIAETMKMKH